MKQYQTVTLTAFALAALATSVYAETVLKGSDMQFFGKKENIEKPIGIMASTTPSGPRPKQPQVLEVNGKGNVLMRGTVTAANGDSLTISSWGGSWTVLPAEAPEIISKDKTISSIAVGDYVGVQGTIVPNTTLTIKAKVVRNRSFDAKSLMPKMEDKKMMLGDKKSEMGTTTMSSTTESKPVMPKIEEKRSGALMKLEEFRGTLKKKMETPEDKFFPKIQPATTTQ